MDKTNLESRAFLFFWATILFIFASLPSFDVRAAEIAASIPTAGVSAALMDELVTRKDIRNDEDISLIALVTMAEAEGESEKGKRLVIDTILNRIDSEHFPDTASEVIYQPSQFSSMWNGRVARCEVREDICQLVREEVESRMNWDVIFFTAGRYSDYGVPMFRIGNHYFSSYK